MKELALAEFEALLASSKDALVMFTADWCPFCRRFASIFEAAKSPGARYVVKVNDDGLYFEGTVIFWPIF